MASPVSQLNPGDHVEWPALGGGAPVSPNNKKQEEEWELLSSESASDQQEEQDETEQNLSDQQPAGQHVVVVSNPKLLYHAASSPDLRRCCDLRAVQEDEVSVDGSFSMVSGPASVVSMASGFSFRDALAASSSSAAAVAENEPETQQQQGNSRTRTRVKPRFVVVQPIKRCAKSTGDLRSLTIQEEEDEEERPGASDAMEFYHRKALGAATRQQGLRLRPDEAKRKQIIMFKKGLQQQASQS